MRTWLAPALIFTLLLGCSGGDDPGKGTQPPEAAPTPKLVLDPSVQKQLDEMSAQQDTVRAAIQAAPPEAVDALSASASECWNDVDPANTEDMQKMLDCIARVEDDFLAKQKTGAAADAGAAKPEM